MIDITTWIPRGKENAIPRSMLCKLTGHDDRDIRKMIEFARTEGVPILSSPEISGYWVSEDIDEIEQFIRQQDRRRNKSAKILSALRKLVADKKGYKVVKVREHYRTIYKDGGGNA